MTVLRRIARPMLASTFFVGAVSAVRKSEQLSPAAAPVTERIVPLLQKAVPQLPIPTDPETLVKLNAAAQLVAAAGLATGRLPRTSSAILVASLVPTTWAGHAFWKEQDPEKKKAQRLQFLKNTSMIGGLLLAAADTEGRPGLAWRTSHAFGAAGRDAKRLAKAARREARLATVQAKAQLPGT